MELTITKEAETHVLKFSKEYKWFSDVYNSLIKAIKHSSEIEIRDMPIGKIEKRTKVNRKRAFENSLYALKISYILAKLEKTNTIIVYKIELT